MTRFTVPGAPHTKGSTVSFLDKRGRLVTKTDSVGLVAWTKAVGWAAKAARVPLAARDVPVGLEVVFRFPCPTKRREYPTVRPDTDKLLRALLDALTGIAYHDDAQVVELFAKKEYGAEACTTVWVEQEG